MEGDGLGLGVFPLGPVDGLRVVCPMTRIWPLVEETARMAEILLAFPDV